MLWDNVSIGPLCRPSIHSPFLEWCCPSFLFGNITSPPPLTALASEMGGVEHVLSSLCWRVTKTNQSIPAPLYPQPPVTVACSEMAPHSIRPLQLRPSLLLKGPGNGYSICCWMQAVGIRPPACWISPLQQRPAWQQGQHGGDLANRWTWLQWYPQRLAIQLCLNYWVWKANGVPHFAKGNFRVFWSLQLKGLKQTGRQVAYPKRKSTFLDAHPHLTRVGRCLDITIFPILYTLFSRNVVRIYWCDLTAKQNGRQPFTIHVV